MNLTRQSLFFLVCILGQFQYLSAQVPDKENTMVVEVKSTTGRIWMDRNLGASEVAKSSLQSSSFGYLYQWGRFSDGHQLRRSRTTKKLSSKSSPGNSAFILSTKSPNDWIKVQNDQLWQGAKGINNPCPVGFRFRHPMNLTRKSLLGSAKMPEEPFYQHLNFLYRGTGVMVMGK